MAIFTAYVLPTKVAFFRITESPAARSVAVTRLATIGVHSISRPRGTIGTGCSRFATFVTSLNEHIRLEHGFLLWEAVVNVVGCDHA
jgi:hypothetical protein